jgi:polar amino acid transport system substrate-binding protein
MKKKLALILAGTAMAAMVLAGCGDKNNASGEDVKTAESVEDKKTFTVGFDAEYPPYGYMDENGEYTGFDLELAEAVCKLEGWELVKKPLNWDSKDMELNSGSIDCIWNGMCITEERKQNMSISDPYLYNTQAMVMKKSREKEIMKSVKGLTGFYR